MHATDLPGRQRAQLRLGEHAGLATAREAATFLAGVAVALRYGPNDALPLASMYQATWRQGGKRAPETERDAQRRATILTNALIEQGTAIETNVIAERLAVMHVAIAPAVIALRRRGKRLGDLQLSDTARRVLGFVRDADRPTAGQVRAHLGVPPRTWPNPAADALAELQRQLLVDRGPADVPDAPGSPYLAADGIPYRVFDVVHGGLVKQAGKLAPADAAGQLVGAYLAGAVFARRSKLASMFKLCLSRAELDAAIAALVAARRLAIATLDGKEAIVAA